LKIVTVTPSEHSPARGPANAEKLVEAPQLSEPRAQPAAPAPDLKPAMDSFMKEIREQIQQMREQIAKIELPQISPSPSPADESALRAIQEDIHGLKSALANLPKPPALEVREDLKPLMESLKRQTEDEIRSLKSRLEALPAPAAEDQNVNQNALAKCVTELGKLKSAVAELQAAKPTAAPAPAVPKSDPAVTQALSSMTLRLDTLTGELHQFRKKVEALPARKEVAKNDEPPAGGTPPPAADDQRGDFLVRMSEPEASPKPSERKVAFVTKLWDYLNEVAIEIPFRKKQD